MNIQQMQNFDVECANIAKEAYEVAQKNANQLQEVQQAIDSHSQVMAVYNDRKEELQSTLQKIEVYKAKTQPKEMAQLVQGKCNEIDKNTDKMRKTFKNGELTIEQFIQQYV